MPDIFVIIVAILLSLTTGGLVIYLLVHKRNNNSNQLSQVPHPIVEQPKNFDVSQDPMILEAKSKAKEIVLEAKDAALKIKTEAETSIRSIREQEGALEKDMLMRKSQLESREREIESKLKTLKQAKEAIDKKQEEVDGMYKNQKEQLEKIASLTRDEARKLLLDKFEKELIEEKGKRIREMEEEIKKTSEEKAKEILIEAMRYGATDYVVEYTTSKVKLPDEDMKGRIIGKEGRNITTFEELTGVELDLDSSPGEVIVSSFDPVRREVAKISLERLISDGRIQPAKIEEIVEKTRNEINHIMYKEGDNLCHRVGVYNLPKDIIQMLGRFKYRFSYGQNLIEHTLEETRIGVAIAHELKTDVETVKLGCLLHDIGKVVSDEEGTHIQLGVDLLKKFNISQKVIDCVAEHHEDKPYSSIESAVVGLADHVSGARPGARSEDYESYVKRLRDLEAAAYSFDGVDKVYAISAGREVRVFVKPQIVDDASTALLAREIAKKIELEQTYPGVVKVVVIRETRISETAK
ncbi:ribonuclease Y [candidate division WWE3 bacterium RIFCSPLOWO2_01_FULL_37_15]|uniref:Ribonuclease Y n=1 Tax=candidate division WWE3 bacterium RIFCSPLOWO2_01_FULL_37_15 TaxID=1802622 RepID=A0A1F4USF7_UNCKA|nr:MAG: ribonuclease Y [candidate division WWE3 bacterium RIFCSPLOWO2_01_FULL_37_15]